MLRPKDAFLICITLLLFASKIILERNEGHGLNLNFIQHDYNVTPERAEVLHYNKDYVNLIKIATFKYNRSTTAFNVTVNFKFDVSEVSKLEVIGQAYKFLSNEYRVFPIRAQVNVCEGLKANVGGSGTYSCGNFTGCPMLKGRTYHVCNWILDQSKLPPYIPTGRYKLDAEFQYSSIEVGKISAYAAVTRPEV